MGNWQAYIHSARLKSTVCLRCIFHDWIDQNSLAQDRTTFTKKLVLHTSRCALRRCLSGSRRRSWFAARRRMCRGSSCMTLWLLPSTGSDTDLIISSSSNARHCMKSTMLISEQTRTHYHTLMTTKRTVRDYGKHANSGYITHEIV